MWGFIWDVLPPTLLEEKEKGEEKKGGREREREKLWKGIVMIQCHGVYTMRIYTYIYIHGFSSIDIYVYAYTYIYIYIQL